jgi:predicted TIM-barrel fold metal-dependent hydrolase
MLARLIIFLSLVLAVTTSCNSHSVAPHAKEAAVAPQTAEPELEVIDAHTHALWSTDPEASSGLPVTREEYLKEMKEANVVGAVSHSHEDSRNEDDLHAYGVIRCAGIGTKVDVARIEKGLKSGKFSCIKIYLGYIHQYPSDKNYEPAYKLAEKYGVPVVFHTGDTYDSKGKLKYSHPLTVDEVAVDHPKVTFVIAHCGNPWFDSAAEVAYKNPNVYLECSALMIGKLSEKSKESIDKLVIQPIKWIFDYLEDPSKLMYGTDWPLVRMKEYLDVYKQAIPREHWNAVFHDNAVRIFKMEKVLKDKPAK